MSDGQTFLLLFICFYLVECCTLVPPGSRVFVRGFGRFYRLRPCLLEFGGIRRQLSSLYFFAWPGRAHVFPPPDDKTLPLVAPPPRYGRYLRFLNRSADSLAVHGSFMWLIFFVIIPVLYFFNPFDERVLLFAGLGYLILFWQTACFCCLHRRFYPKRGEDRLKHTLTMAFLPWHGMKAVDHLVLRPKLQLDPLHQDALLLSPQEFRKRVPRAWREACYGLEVDEKKLRVLEDFLEAVGVDPGEFKDERPSLGEGEQYCPVCHVTYQAVAEMCADCGEVPLRK